MKLSNRFSRRRILQTGVVAALAIGFGGAGIAWWSTTVITLAAVVDTIIPADEHSPGASAVNAHTRILQQARRSTRNYLLLQAGMIWLDIKAGGSFATASETDRVALLNDMAAGKTGKRFQKLFIWIRMESFRHYYGNAPAALQLGFVGAPQPAGYPYYDRPWKT